MPQTKGFGDAVFEAGMRVGWAIVLGGLGLFLILTMAGCVTDAEPTIIAATPASVEISCVSALGGCRSAQSVVDLAEGHCRKSGLHARTVDIARAPSGNERAMFDCVALQPGART